ncbi:DUF1232 domain-containing protein [Tumebacillus sp. DT12]|uniref:DUF1232 domain-containing protein n=1 Tax=Tumebacillus lacus TaxID=2995335 RepID=A0ABT3X2U3_9BACL|nr:DUF1232 domain-containing protein [Tumebacillus lacus]MCX7571224.1 DUF1232 domain-containing protein [Tumebacillus lacus]
MNKPSFFQNVVGMFKDKHTPLRDKLLIAGGTVYILSPVDLVPDLIMLLGYTDDLAVLIGTYRVFRRSYNNYVRRSDVVAEQEWKWK